MSHYIPVLRKKGHFFCGDSAGPVNFQDYSSFFKENQRVWTLGQLESFGISLKSFKFSSKSFIRAGRDSARAPPSSGRAQPSSGRGQLGSKISFPTDGRRSRTCWRGDPMFSPYFPKTVESSPGDHFRGVYGPH